MAALAVVAVAVAAHPVEAQADAQQSVAQRCFERHKFGAQPVDVAKTADGQTVLAQTSWNWHDAIGCYLTLGDTALAALRAAPAPLSLTDTETEASTRCFEHHKFGQRPVDVAKSADRQTVLARLSWGYHDSIGCYLVLDDTALTTLRAAAVPDNGYTAISAGGSHSCALDADGKITCWGHNTWGQASPPAGAFTG